MPLGNIPPEGLVELFSELPILKYKRGETILRADETPSGVFLVVKGFVRIYSILESGREITLTVYKKGSCFPLFWALADIPNGYFFQSLTETQVIKAPRDLVVEFMKEHPDSLFNLIKQVLIGLDGILTNLEYQFSGDAYHKVVSVVFLSAERFGVKDAKSRIHIKLPLTHQDIANLTGLTRETVSLILRQLKEKKIISYVRRYLTINDIGRLDKESHVYKYVPGAPSML